MDDSEVSKMEFEDSIKELEDIVSKLECGSVSLKDSVSMYERGVLLKKHCEDLLNSARLKIQQIVTDEREEIFLQEIKLED